jgi:hypothetical protein
VWWDGEKEWWCKVNSLIFSSHTTLQLDLPEECAQNVVFLISIHRPLSLIALTQLIIDIIEDNVSLVLLGRAPHSTSPDHWLSLS